MPATPSGPVTIRMYNVGFGDCFLMTIPYSAADGGARHVLVDFGSFPSPKGAPKGFQTTIARDIAQRCQGGRLVVVATHRHKDHISGFATNAKGTASGDVIRAIKPEIVLQPWTEHPQAAQNAHKAPAMRQAARGFRRALAAQAAYGQTLARVADRLPAVLGADVRRQLAFVGENSVSSLAAVKNLMTMGKRKARYLHAGKASGLEGLLPGVKVHVLGPPTLEQDPGIDAPYAKKSDDYWLRRRQIALAAFGRGPAGPARLFPRVKARRAGAAPAHARWFIRRLREAYRQELLSIVTALDDVMNNTSLILLFEVGDQKLLFPGDAQLENWSYALREHAALLDGVTVYKVGHHGSLNATPKRLWRLMTEGDTAAPSAAFRTLLSTQAHVHGGKHGRPTEVPRGPLVDALRAKSQLTTTLDRDDFGAAQTVRL
jgi:hypothetical protein